MEWNPELYVSKHSFVYEGGRDVLALLAPQPGEHVLDLGCGTGQLTQAIAESGANVTGLDTSAAMIDAARRAYPKLSFVQSDATNFTFPKPFDAVFSNAAMHWMNPAERAVQCVARSLREGGRFAVELAGKGHIAQLRRAVDTTWREMTGREFKWNLYSPSISQFSAGGCGLEVREARLFDVQTKLEDGKDGLHNFLKMFGGESLRGVPENAVEKSLRRIEEIARPALSRNGSWYLDRRRIRVLTVKSSV
ncbi:MAG: class I SAM-dependent methyltransferase [Candidatus Acidiferrales bacterium]